MKLSLEITKYIGVGDHKEIRFIVKVSDLPDDKELAEILSRPIFYQQPNSATYGIVPDLYSGLGKFNIAEFVVDDDLSIEKIVNKIKNLYEDVINRYNDLKNWTGTQHVEYKI